MNLLKKGLLSTIVISGVLLSSCASVPMASIEQDANAKKFTTNPKKAKIYIYRNEMLGTGIKLPVLIDNMSVGDTTTHTYIMKEVNPGKHTILSKAERDAKLELNTVAGKNYFVWQEVKMGVIAARTALHQVNDTTGMAGVRECKSILTSSMQPKA